LKLGPNDGRELNAGGRKADVQEDSLEGGLELNNDRRLHVQVNEVSIP